MNKDACDYKDFATRLLRVLDMARAKAPFEGCVRYCPSCQQPMDNNLRCYSCHAGLWTGAKNGPLFTITTEEEGYPDSVMMSDGINYCISSIDLQWTASEPRAGRCSHKAAGSSES